MSQAADGDRVVHAYGVLPPEAPIPTWPAGIASAPVSTVADADVVALVSMLPADEYDPATWESHADDATWLGAVAVGHHRVLQAAIAADDDVVPFRLPSLYGDVDALRQALHDHAGDVAEALERVRGRVEWGVKVYRAEGSGEKVTSAASGSDYLRSRSRQLRTRAETDDRQRQHVREAYDRLQGLSAAAVRNPPQDPVLSGRREPMLLNAAFLVSRAEQDRFREGADEVARRYRSEGLQLEVSGPWPAYNFAVFADPDGESS